MYADILIMSPYTRIIVGGSLTARSN